MDFATRAKNLEYKFTDVEEQIAEYILEHKTELADMKIVTLAKMFFTVPNTVTRFCHKLGYEGFSELKIELRHELDNQQVSNKQLDTIVQNFELIESKREAKVVKILQKAS